MRAGDKLMAWTKKKRTMVVAVVVLLAAGIAVACLALNRAKETKIESSAPAPESAAPIPAPIDSQK